MFQYTTETGKTKVVDINVEACMQARVEGMSWAQIGTGETLEGGVLERTTRFGRNCNQASLGLLRASNEWADAVRAFAVDNGLNVDETVAKWCRAPRVQRIRTADPLSRGETPSTNGAQNGAPSVVSAPVEPTPTFAAYSHGVSAEVSAAETILRSEQRIAMSDLTAAHKTAMVELKAAHVRAMEELRIAQVSAEQAMLTEHAGALEALKASEAAEAEAAKAATLSEQADAKAAAEAAEAEADNEGGDEPPSPPPSAEPTEDADAEEDAEVSDVATPSEDPTEDADVTAEAEHACDAHAYSHDADAAPLAEHAEAAEEARVDELQKRKEHLVRKGEMLKAQYEEATNDATQSALHGLMHKNRGEILAIANELGEPNDADKGEELAA